MKRVTAILLIAVLLCLVSCGSGNGNTPGGTTGGTTGETGNTRMSFSEAIDMNRINELSGKTVEIVGYMATVSPVSGKYIYLMNLPYQSCPYCVPNTQQLSNTIAVYAKNGDKFEFTDGPINVTGTLETGDFKDEYGYTYNYRIKDAVYSPVNSTEASKVLALWEKISNAGIAADVYSMFDYIDFECNWPNYTAKFQEGEAYLYPADVPVFEKGQFAAQNAEDFFSGLIGRAEKIGDSVMDELIKIVRDGEALKDKAVAERENKRYTYDKDTDRFTLTNGESMRKEAQNLYVRFAQWLENFSLSK